MKKPKRPKDFIDNNGQRYRAFENVIKEHNGAIPSCAYRECTFFRRGECWATDYGCGCTWPYFWRKVDKDGNILDRDGFVYYTKEMVEKYPCLQEIK